MKYAIIADVHANLPALDAVIDDIEKRGDIDAMYHLGDLVGYAPWPNEVVERIRTLAIPGIAGNYDSTVATDYKHCGCKYEDARQEELSHLSYAWTREAISPAAKKYLLSLPFRLDIRPMGGHTSKPTVTLLHGNNILNTVYMHDARPDDQLEKLGAAIGAQSGDVVCFGHTHIYWHRELGGVHFINAGSVGRPKDGDWRAGYLLLDISVLAPSVTAEYVRVAYDVDVAASAIPASGLPEDFAQFLRSGGKLTAQ